MKVKTFYPVFITTDPNGMIETMESFGFEQAHKKMDISDHHNTNTVLKDGNGNHVDVVSSTVVPHTLVAIRVNVEDYEDAVAELAAKGYENRRPDGVGTPSSLSTMMVSPDGVMYLICEHIK